jgi:hypothetical protein
MTEVILQQVIFEFRRLPMLLIMSCKNPSQESHEGYCVLFEFRASSLIVTLAFTERGN